MIQMVTASGFVEVMASTRGRRLAGGMGARWEKATGALIVQKDYVHLGNSLVATYGLSPVTQEPGGWLFYTNDHLGSPRLITDLQAQTQAKPKYRTFGLAFSDLSQGPTFAAMERSDPTSTNFHDHARVMWAWTGRFNSPDKLSGVPDDPLTWNLYSYAANNPLRYLDPTGLYVTDCGADDTQCQASAAKFEAARQVDLARGGDVAAGAAAYGNPGTLNGVTIHFGAPGEELGGTTTPTFGWDNPNVADSLSIWSG